LCSLVALRPSTALRMTRLKTTPEERQIVPYRNVAQELAGSPFASIEYREETGSTNADAAELLGDDSYGGHTIVAEFPRHGAGRKGRSWHAMPGTALLF